MSTQAQFKGCGFVLAFIGVGFAVSLALVALASTLAPSSGASLDRNDRAASRSSGSYTVRPGDTLSGIADRYRTTVESLAAANGLVDVNQIEVGQQLRVDGEVRPSSAKPKPRPRARPTATKPRSAPTRKRSPVEEPDAIIEPDFTELLVESLVAQVRLRGYRCDSVSAAQRGLLGSKIILTCNQYRYRFVFEDRGGRLFFTVK